ncbi:MAG: type 11 methyltransferase [Chloroflexi bacterium OLB14]|nr:MAG: type 11 methyltransferase [Chloroflexi bacterium OLB14]
MATKLKLLPIEQYKGVNNLDPIKYYYWPVFGKMYRRRVELALEQCTGGKRVLEVGFGTGLAFPNLHDNYEEIHGLDLTADIEAVKSVFEPIGIPLFLKKGDVLNMPYEDNYFDTVLLISIMEHLKPNELKQACAEVKRVLKPGGQMVYGTPVERPFMVFMFKMLGHNIRNEHFSTEKEIRQTAEIFFEKTKLIEMKATPSFMGGVYEVGNFTKALE